MYLDILAKIKNAQAAGQETVKFPFSNFNLAILEVLERNKFIESVSKKGRMPKRIIEVRVRYKKDQGVIHTVKVMSKPSRRLYVGYKDLRPVRQGYGIAVISTPQGVMDDRSARKAKIGGQLLFEIW